MACAISLGFVCGQESQTAVGVVEFKIGTDGAPILLPGKIDDGKETNFIVDTGSSEHALAKQFTKSLTKLGEKKIVTQAGTSMLMRYASPSIWLADVKLTKKKFVYSVDLTMLQMKIGKSLGGIIGNPAFADSTLEIDFQKGVLKRHPGSFSPSTADLALPFTLEGGVPKFKCTLWGEDVVMILDSGAVGTTIELNAKLFKSLLAKKAIKLGKDEISQTIAGFVKYRSGIADTVDFSGIELDDVHIDELSDNRLGLAGMARFDVVINYPKRMLFLSKRSDNFSKRVSTRDLIGISVGFTANGPRIMKITPNSEAQRAGLQPGDQILKIGTHPREPLDGYSLRDYLLSVKGKEVELVTKRGNQKKTIKLKVNKMD